MALEGLGKIAELSLRDVDRTCQDCGMRSVAIAYNPTSRDWNPVLDAFSLAS
jgi:hypothetical protein